MRKHFLWVIFVGLICFLLPYSVKAEERYPVHLYLFYSSTCTHCHAEREFLNDIQGDYPYLTVHMYEVTENKDNNELLEKVKKKLGSETKYVPFTVVGTQRFVGFNANIQQQILEKIQELSLTEHVDVVDHVIRGIDDEIEVPDNSTNESGVEEGSEVIVPVLGKIDPQAVSLPLLAVVIGSVDGFNPCAMWVLLFLISMLFGMKNRKKMWVLGVTFLVSSALVYLLFMVAWLKIAVSFTAIRWIQLLIAAVALIGAFVNLRSYWKSVKKDTGCQVVNDSKRQKIFNWIRHITSNKSFVLAILGIIALAVSVNVIELACSAGLPLLFTQILALNSLAVWQYWLYILFYIFFFLLDDLIIFIIAMVTFRVTGISTKYTKYSHLIGGILMFLIGLLMILKPEWLMFNF